MYGMKLAGGASQGSHACWDVGSSPAVRPSEAFWDNLATLGCTHRPLCRLCLDISCLGALLGQELEQQGSQPGVGGGAQQEPCTQQCLANVCCSKLEGSG